MGRRFRLQAARQALPTFQTAEQAVPIVSLLHSEAPSLCATILRSSPSYAAWHLHVPPAHVPGSTPWPPFPSPSPPHPFFSASAAVGPLHCHRQLLTDSGGLQPGGAHVRDRRHHRLQAEAVLLSTPRHSCPHHPAPYGTKTRASHSFPQPSRKNTPGQARESDIQPPNHPLGPSRCACRPQGTSRASSKASRSPSKQCPSANAPGD